MKLFAKTHLTLITGLFLLFNSSLAFSKSSEQHFASLSSPDIKTAKCNIKAYNEKLNALTTKSEISAIDMVKVHELTYTLEDALKRLVEDLSTAANELEKAHKASESLNDKTVRDASSVYSKLTNELLAPTNC